jgi:acyl carrier protein
MLNTEQLVKNALARTLNFSDTAAIQKHHHLKKDLQLDSMNSMMFLIKLEEMIDGFWVDPLTFKMKHLETVSSIVEYVNAQLFLEEDYLH